MKLWGQSNYLVERCYPAAIFVNHSVVVLAQPILKLAF